MAARLETEAAIASEIRPPRIIGVSVPGPAAVGIRADGTAIPARTAPPLYASPHLGDGIQPDMARIVETLYAVDAFKDYDDLERNLEVGEGRSDYATLREHLDKAEQRARRAHRLYLGSKLELTKWELDQNKVSSGMREKAREALEKDESRSKRITNDDVDAKIVELFSDEVAHQEVTKAKMRGAVDSLEHLVRRWDMKAGDIRVLLETLRK